VTVFIYRAVQPDGKTRKGQLTASNEAEAFARLREENLSPFSLKVAHAKPTTGGLKRFIPGKKRMGEAETEALLGSMAILLRAGADIRTALNVLADDQPELKTVTQKILSGASVELSLSPLFTKADSHLGALIAAGEVRGDLPSGLEAAASVIATRRKIREQLFEAVSYPFFVFITAIAALFVILLVVVPAIAPLLSESDHKMPVYFRVIVWLSGALQVAWPYLLAGLIAGAAFVTVGYVYGGLKKRMSAWMVDGPLGSIASALVYGGYARSLGDMLSRGAGLSEGLRLCQRSVGNDIARERLETVAVWVRQGRLMSEGLRGVKGMPRPIVKLAEVGETSGALGPMLARAGEREEADALQKITRLSRLLGPLLIMVLGAMIGLIMGGVLTALTDIGSIAGN
jgi:general secretion pathway protein F